MVAINGNATAKIPSHKHKRFHMRTHRLGRIRQKSAKREGQKFESI